jgi:hypothetical protein
MQTKKNAAIHGLAAERAALVPAACPAFIVRDGRHQAIKTLRLQNLFQRSVAI